MFLKFDQYTFYSKLVDCILFKIIGQHICVVKGTFVGGHAVVRKEKNLKFSPLSQLSLTSSLNQLREKSSSPVFIICGEY